MDGSVVGVLWRGIYRGIMDDAFGGELWIGHFGGVLWWKDLVGVLWKGYYV